MSVTTFPWRALLIAGALMSSACGVDSTADVGDPTVAEEGSDGTIQSELLGFRVAPALERELIRINNTETGRMVVTRARNRGLHTVRVGPLAGNIVGLYQSNGVITIEEPNNAYTFQRLAHELLHAAGYHPHFFPDKGMIGKICNQANAVCPSWN